MWWFIAIFVVGLVIAYAMSPKPTTPKPSGFDDVTAPTAEDGREVPVLFGTRVMEGPNCVWYGDLRNAAIIK